MGYPKLQEGQASPTSFTQAAVVKFLEFLTMNTTVFLITDQEYSVQIVKDPSQRFACITSQWDRSGDCLPTLPAHAGVLCLP